MSRRVHLPKPTAGVSVVDTLPLFCGAKRDADTLTTCFDRRATCRRCLAQNRLYQEDLDYRRTQAKLQAERERQVST
jgi:hypothetical protein